MSSWRDLNRELAQALGLPKGTVRAVLTLDAHEPPRIDITAHVHDANGLLILEPDPSDPHAAPLARRIARVRFLIRLERIPDPLEPTR